MSSYLVDRIAGLSNVEVLTRTTITGLEGHDGKLEAIRCGPIQVTKRATQSNICSCSSGRSPTPIGSPDRAWQRRVDAGASGRTLRTRCAGGRSNHHT
jgi:hypothetical protein